MAAVLLAVPSGMLIQSIRTCFASLHPSTPRCDRQAGCVVTFRNKRLCNKVGARALLRRMQDLRSHHTAPLCACHTLSGGACGGPDPQSIRQPEQGSNTILHVGQCFPTYTRPPAHSSKSQAGLLFRMFCCSTITGARNMPSRRLYDGTKTADCVNMCARRHLNCMWGAQLHWYSKSLALHCRCAVRVRNMRAAAAASNKIEAYGL